MPEIIEIEGNVARLITKSVVRQIPLNEILSRVETRTPVTLPKLARSQRFAHWDDSNPQEKKMFMLCELPPAIRSITKNVRRNEPRGMRRYRLSMPWTYFWFVATTGDSDIQTTFNWSIQSSRVFFSREEYSSPSSPLMFAPLPNLNSIGEVCWGSTGSRYEQVLADQLDQRVNEWYVSEFNDDLDSSIVYPYGERNMRRWVQESRENPGSWRDWPEWTRPDRITNVHKLIEEYHMEIELTERFSASSFIPTIELPATYGHWDSWWMRIPPEQRRNAFTALDNLRLDDPANLPEPEPAPEIEDQDRDDGGVPV